MSLVTQEECDIYNNKILSKLVSTDYPIQPSFKDLTGMTFGRLHVDKYAGRDRYKKSWFWCTCECGNKILRDNKGLKCHHAKSCGCLSRELTSERNKNNIIHGDSKRENIAHLYSVWSKMKDRCYNPKAHNYANYGERGITVCKEWLDSKNGYNNFKTWALENGYKDNCGLSIDRIDSNLGYCPENCRWVTDKIQNNNKRGTVYGIIGNWVLPIGIWAEISEIPRKKIYSRLERGWNYKDAIFTPLGKPKGTVIGIINVPEEYEKYNKYDEFIKNNKLIEFYNPLRIRMYFKSSKY